MTRRSTLSAVPLVLVVGILLLLALAPLATAAPAPWPQTWASPFVTDAAKEFRFLTAGPAGSAYAVGSYVRSAPGMSTMVLTRLAAGDGTLRWPATVVTQGPGGTGAVPLDVATQRTSQDLIVAGVSHQSVDPDAYVGRFAAADGHLIWQRSWNGAAREGDQAAGVAVDANGNVYAVGSSDTAGAWGNGMVLKYDKTGAFKWKYVLASTRDDGLWDCAVDSAGNLYATGEYNSNSDTAGSLVTIKVSPAGRLLWRSTITAPGASCCGWFLRVRGTSVYVGGTREGDGARTIVARYTSSGTLKWKRTSSRAITNFAGMTVDGKGRLVTVGDFQAAPPALPVDGGWVEVWSPATTASGPLWETTFTYIAATAEVHDASLSAVAVDSTGRIYCAGSWDTMPDGGGTDAVVVSYAPSGASSWSGPDRSWTHDDPLRAADSYFGLLRVSDAEIYACGYESGATGWRGLVEHPRTVGFAP